MDELAEQQARMKDFVRWQVERVEASLARSRENLAREEAAGSDSVADHLRGFVTRREESLATFRRHRDAFPD